MTLRCIALVAPLLVAATVSREAVACPMPDTCSSVDYWYAFAPFNAAKIPTDGALVLRGAHRSADDAAWLDKIEIAVLKDGEAVAGALETTSQAGVLLWRPTTAWTPGATYQMTAKLTNPLEEFDVCGEPTIEFAADLVIDNEPAAALAPPTVMAAVKTLDSVQLSLLTLACCTGVAPMETFVGCNGYSVAYEPTTCTSTQLLRYMLVDVTGTPAVSGPTSGQVGYTLKIDGKFHSQSLEPSFSFTTVAPGCAVIEAEDLVTGDITVSAEQCFGQDIAATLGLQLLDATATLECELQQCTPEDGTWNLGKCTPYEPPGAHTDTDTDTAGPNDGKGCNVAGDSEGGGNDLLAMLAMLVVLTPLGAKKRRRSAP